MKKVQREDLLDYVTYGDQRDGIRAEVLAAKKPRRIHLGEVLTFLFENAETMRYQIQEMMRAEQIVKEADIKHELETYNGLLPDAQGELGCTLLIELEDASQRAEKLARWLDLPGKIYARVAGGEKVYARFDTEQVGQQRLSSVQYLRFPLGGRVPEALGCEHPDLEVEAELSPASRAALEADLRA